VSSPRPPHAGARHVDRPRGLDRRRFLGGMLAAAAALAVRDRIADDVVIAPPMPGGTRWIGHC
jgi:hypothetical protein